MTRTQIYLSEEQRKLLERAAKRERVSMAEVVRRAVDQYFGRISSQPDPKATLESTLGALPHLEVPSRAEWDRSSA